MGTNDILSKVKSILHPYVQEKDKLDNLTEQTDFVNDLHINSANIVDIVIDIENTFNIQVENEAIEKMFTVGAAISVINSKINNDSQ